MNCNASCQRAAARVQTWGEKKSFLGAYTTFPQEMYFFGRPEGCWEGAVGHAEMADNTETHFKGVKKIQRVTGQTD